MTIDKRSLKKMFPNLYRELEDESSENKVSVDGVCDDLEVAEEIPEIEDVCEEEFLRPAKQVDKLQNFVPSVVDFIRRCDTNEQAQEIISYLQKKGELTQDQVDELECKLKREGVRSFGPKKEENHYFHEIGLY
jgi:hypothetical protein